ncbi:MFS transporter [Flavobacterium enshiense]|uniref:Fosmidomycin resistance protein n=1 Tax=Flavobacterium enshiense DK69 TaxID=1107311 RepID=A0A0A2MX96_9FLAO|nr:MFS transporter [Flavobacterium enshiense]KGO97322.1 Fosmidomycin resistance protein [Flavobacterium enshiense DK69]
MKTATATATIEKENKVQTTVYSILFSICFAHMINDLLQAVIPAMYPVLKANYGLTFTQVGLITFTYQVTASLLQPFVGIYTDKKPKPYSLAFGMLFSLSGIIMLSQASSFPLILVSVAMVGVGSSIFHPEASRVAFLGSGGKRGLAQSIFQLGGNTGTAIGPLLVALIVVPRGQSHILWFVLVAVVGIIVLSQIAVWYQQKLISLKAKKKAVEKHHDLSPARVKMSVVLLLILIFSKSFYTSSMSSYFTFYLIEKFHISVLQAQYHLFWFLGAVALGTLIGGPLGDKFGRKYIIWFSILGAAPFTLMLPFANLFWTGILSVAIGIIIASAFSAILVYAQELMPERVGMISGLFFGFAFGVGGLGSAVLGYLADVTSIEFVYGICSFLPLIGIIAYFLPNLKKK